MISRETSGKVLPISKITLRPAKKLLRTPRIPIGESTDVDAPADWGALPGEEKMLNRNPAKTHVAHRSKVRGRPVAQMPHLLKQDDALLKPQRPEISTEAILPCQRAKE